MKRPAALFACTAVIALSACGPTQSPACAHYVSCQQAVDASEGLDHTERLAPYLEDGACWTDEDTADSCTRACEGARESYESAYGSIPECQPE